MGNYVHAEIGYHEGDPLPGSIEVPERPSPHHAWDGAKWTLDLPALKAAAVGAVESRALWRMQRFEADPSALYAKVAIVRAEIEAKTKKTDVEAVRDTAITEIEAM